ncbi:hypothetical protein AXF42_Ash021145 [Apostasia shenzhenica]|uniref:Uncharacterized protein n=1 Tax=Apostasia shenzhenica TaxID=1088818 RepID=A0A2I0ADX3_9ASPA|nr:hypothetical protein AXF42_Ash021145 [Apostasia shenzhenica]
MGVVPADLYSLPLALKNFCERGQTVREVAERKKWVTLSSITKKRASDPPANAPPAEKRRLSKSSEGSPKPAMTVPVEVSQEEEVGAAVINLEAEAPLVRVTTVLAQTLESVHEPAGVEATKVMNVSDSLVKLPPKARELKEVALVSKTTAGEKLVPRKILLKDEEIELLFPRFGAPGEKKSSLMVCGPAPFVIPTPSEKKRKPLFPSFLPANLRNNEEKEKKGRKEEGNKMEEVIKGKKDVPSQVAPESTLGIEGLEGEVEGEIKGKERVPPAPPMSPPTMGGHGVC